MKYELTKMQISCTITLLTRKSDTFIHVQQCCILDKMIGKEKTLRFSLIKKHLLKIVTVMLFPKRYSTIRSEMHDTVLTFGFVNCI